MGFIKLKNVYGRYSKVETPKLAATKAPQVFQGTKTDVKVPPSSKDLDKDFRLIFIF